MQCHFLRGARVLLGVESLELFDFMSKSREIANTCGTFLLVIE